MNDVILYERDSTETFCYENEDEDFERQHYFYELHNHHSNFISRVSMRIIREFPFQIILRANYSFSISTFCSWKFQDK